jgi:hypothetical protein
MAEIAVGDQSPTEAGWLWAWLEALPEGTGLVDCGQPNIPFLWQVFDRHYGRSIDCAGPSARLLVERHEDMLTATFWAPYTVVWLPPAPDIDTEDGA